MGERRLSLGWRQLTVLVFGTPLNPLNSSMIAVALVRLRADIFRSAWAWPPDWCRASTSGRRWRSRWRAASATASARAGSTCGGLVVVLLTGAAAPFAPAFGWLVLG